MNINKMYPSRWMKAEHLDGNTIVTIARVEMAEFEQTGDEKPAVYFEETEMALIMNKTNAGMIAEIIGSEDTDDWTGKQIGLRKEMVQFKATRVPAIRVFDPAPPKTTGFGKKTAPQSTDSEDVPSSWPSDSTPAAEATLEASGSEMFDPNAIPDPGQPMTGKRRK